MCAAVPRLISPLPSELEPIVGLRHNGSEQSQPARFAICSLVFSEKSSRFFFAIGRGYATRRTLSEAEKVTVSAVGRKYPSSALTVFVAGIVPPNAGGQPPRPTGRVRARPGVSWPQSVAAGGSADPTSGGVVFDLRSKTRPIKSSSGHTVTL